MGSDFRHGFPAIELSMTSLAVDRRGLERLLRAEAFSLIRQLFSLPLETKKKNVNPKPFHGYCGEYPHVPLYESLGLEDASNFEAVREFTELLWPNGHDHFW
ncbi:hypothetical protein Pyn_19618 [Prunus yedoensis var. nudiflora]|uniref:Uncharacterized protein n=1 Tax=Prunus yedoensis var. nudiflora TaxID=2094558 RepID=A0A314XLG7_PRUYE|nr:hypothetical protein Pyn_19618 [Prunus yedoensis var. nudiflora]